jgi:phage terminase Nu1 subunit (DNA packaging protein)
MADNVSSNARPVGFIAALLNITERRIQQLAKEQIIPKPDHRGEYDLVGCIKGYVMYLQERAERSEEPQRVRLDRLRADQVELELSRMKGDLVPIAELAPALDRYVTDVCAVIDGVPERYAQMLHETADLDGKHQVLLDAAREIREVLGSYEFAVKRVHSEAAAANDSEIQTAA